MNDTLTDKEIAEIEIKNIKKDISNILKALLIGSLIILVFTLIGVFL